MKFPSSACRILGRGVFYLDIIYQDKRILVAVKPSGVLSTDEPGGMPELLRRELGYPNASVRTVHRLDRTVSGLMVFARSKEATRILSRQMQDGEFHKEYLAVVHGCPEEKQGEFRDLLLRDKARKMTLVTDTPGKDAREAILQYTVLDSREGMSLVRIRLLTGRTHQIRVQFSSRGLPLAGDRKYGKEDGINPIALWSCCLRFSHPETGEIMEFSEHPPAIAPWDLFSFG